MVLVCVAMMAVVEVLTVASAMVVVVVVSPVNCIALPAGNLVDLLSNGFARLGIVLIACMVGCGVVSSASFAVAGLVWTIASSGHKG